jgi:predicted component of type VI protein secretion system
MENNNAKILWLRNELVAPQARLERLQNRDERIEWRLEDKFTDIANVLQTEITKRTDVINQLDNSQVIAALTKEIETITEVKNNIKTLQDANASLAQLNNPVTPTDQTAVTGGADNNTAVTNQEQVAANTGSENTSNDPRN